MRILQSTKGHSHQVAGFDEWTPLHRIQDPEEERTGTRKTAPDSTKEELFPPGAELGMLGTSGANVWPPEDVILLM